MVVRLTNSDQDELEDLFSQWLTKSLKHFNTLKEDWQDRLIIQPHPTSETRFQCNNCGVCCQFTQYWVWVYPRDIFNWCRQIDQDPRIPFLFCFLYPVTDSRGAKGYGIPSQLYLLQSLNKFIRLPTANLKEKTFFRNLRGAISWINPGFSPKSNFCAFYDPNNPFHCTIHDIRMIQCRSYPYDYACFSQFQMSPEVLAKYGDFYNEDPTRPLCPPDAFNPAGNFQRIATTNEERNWVLEEKISYSLSEQDPFDFELDISEILMEIFSEDIINVNLDHLSNNPKKIFTKVRFQQN